MSKNNGGHSLAVASFLENNERIKEFIANHDLKDVLYFAEDKITRSEIDLQIGILKRKLDWMIETKPWMTPEYAIEETVKSVYDDKKIIEVVRRITGGKAGNLEIALLTNGRCFNRRQLEEKIHIPESTKIIKDSLEGVMRKKNNYFPIVANSKEIDIFNAPYPNIPTDTLNELVKNILNEYLSNNFEVINGLPKSKRLVKKGGTPPIEDIASSQVGKGKLPLITETTSKPETNFWKQYGMPITAVSLAFAILAIGVALGVNALKNNKSKNPLGKKVIAETYEATLTPQGIDMILYKTEGLVVQFEYNKGEPTKEEISGFENSLTTALEDVCKEFKTEYKIEDPEFKKNLSIDLMYNATCSIDGPYEHNRELAKDRELSTEKMAYEVLEELGFDRENIRITRSNTPETISDEDYKLLEERAKNLNIESVEKYVSLFNELGELNGSDPEECKICQGILEKYRASFIKSVEVRYNDKAVNQ